MLFYALLVHIYVALYICPGHETGQGWAMKLGNLEGEI